MSVATAIESLKSRVGESFDAVSEMNGTLPESRTTHTLPAAIRSITPKPNVPSVSFYNGKMTSLDLRRFVVCDMVGLTSLSRMFHGCSSLKSLNLPAGFGSSATTLDSCFGYCSNLTSLTLPAGFGSKATDASSCFSDCSSLTTLTLPAGFGSAATTLVLCFSNCSSLTTLTLPAGFGVAATTLDSCFGYCSNLTSLTLPAGFGSATTIVGACFSDCSSLTTLTLPDGFGQKAKSLSDCFVGCSSLTTITGNPNFKVSVSFSQSKKLTHDSIMVIVNGLQTVTSKQKLTLGATNLAKLTTEEKRIATGKGWTLA